MPVKPCQRGGKKGYKWGDKGKCYLGPGAKKKAAEQGGAVKASQARRKSGKRG